MLTLYKKIFKDNKRGMIGYSIGFFAYSLMMASMYPTFSQSNINFEEYIEQFPEALRLAFGIDLGGFTFNSFIGMEYLNLFWIIIALFFIAGFAARIIAGEVEKGTIEVLLSRPISRLKTAFAQMLVFVTILILLIGITLLGFWVPSLWASEIVIDWGPLINTMLVLFLFCLAIFGYSFFFSSFSSNKGRVLGFSATLTLVFYFMNFVALYWEQISFLKYYTLFYYYRGVDLLKGAPIVFTDILVFIMVFLVFTAAGLIIYKKRDICVK